MPALPKPLRTSHGHVAYRVVRAKERNRSSADNFRKRREVPLAARDPNDGLRAGLGSVSTHLGYTSNSLTDQGQTLSFCSERSRPQVPGSTGKERNSRSTRNS